MSLEQQIAVAIADCRFDKALSAAFGEKVKSSPVLGLSFLEKLGASLAAGGSHTAVPTSSSGPVLGLQSGMSEAHAAVLISYVVRVMRAMSFEECMQSAQQLDTTLQHHKQRVEQIRLHAKQIGGVRVCVRKQRDNRPQRQQCG